MVNFLSYLLMFIILLLLIYKIFTITKKDKEVISTALYKRNSLFLYILSIYLICFSSLFSYFFKSFYRTYCSLFPEYINGFIDMFNYNKLISIYYNSLISSNMQSSKYYIYNYINTGLPNLLNIILLTLIFIILIVNYHKNKICENVIYEYGIRYKYDNIKDFKWSEKKSKKTHGKEINYYNLIIVIANKHKNFDECRKNIILPIKENDKEKVNSFFNLKLSHNS